MTFKATAKDKEISRAYFEQQRRASKEIALARKYLGKALRSKSNKTKTKYFDLAHSNFNAFIATMQSSWITIESYTLSRK
jgi:hypothetical protein